MKVAVFSTKYYEKEYLNKHNANTAHELIYFDVPLNKDSLALTIGYDAVCVTITDTINKQAILGLAHNNIQLIDLRTAGYDYVDITAAAENNITVMRVPAYSPEAIAEHATALILTLNRKTHKAYNRVREHNFSINNLMGFNLNGKTVGVIGTGKIGRAFCNIMQGFGCSVIAYDIKQSPKVIAKGIAYKSFDEVLAQSDIVAIHCPLNEQTKYLFNAAAFAKMKKGAMLINTSRGAVINTTDAIEALKTEQLGYLGIDVYEGEAELFFKDLSNEVIDDDVMAQLLSFSNVLVTPHQAFFTTEAVNEIAKITIKNFTDFENGGKLENQIIV